MKVPRSTKRQASFHRHCTLAPRARALAVASISLRERARVDARKPFLRSSQQGGDLGRYVFKPIMTKQHYTGKKWKYTTFLLLIPTKSL